MIEPNNLPKNLIIFLKANDCLKKFIFNSLTTEAPRKEYPYEDSDWISYAFPWRASYEGHSYWGKLSDNWRKQCNLDNAIKANLKKLK